MNNFTKNERRALLFLISLGFLIQYATNSYEVQSREIEVLGLGDYSLADTLVKPYKRDSVGIKNHGKSGSSLVKSPLDFNKIDSLELISLGFKAYVVRNMIKYREAGADLNNWRSLKKIYGIDTVLLNRISRSFSLKKTHPMSLEQQKININTADSLQLKALYGIGPVLASRIVKYRDRLGGFISKDQIKEVYGVPEEIFINNPERIICEGPVKKININTASWDSFRRHYYFNTKTIQAIINYRMQHGPYSDAKDLKKIALIQDSIYNRIWPYCAIN